MHKIAEKEFTIDDFSHEHLDIRTHKILEETIKVLNDYRNIYILTIIQMILKSKVVQAKKKFGGR